MASRLKQRIITTIALVLALCAICTPGFAQSTQPTLTVDLRAVSTTSGMIFDEKHVLFTGGAGDTVRMQIWGVVSGGVNGTIYDDWIDYLLGSFLSSSEGLRGNLRASSFYYWFGYNGTRQDLDGDGDIDVGSNNDAEFNDFYYAMAGQDALNIPVVQLGDLTWTYTGSNGQTLINFRPRNAPDAAFWVVDGMQQAPSIAPFQGGIPVNIAFVPELSVSSAALASAFALLALTSSRIQRRPH